MNGIQEFPVHILTCSTEFNACHDKSIHSFCVFIDDGVRVCVGPWRGFKFSVKWASKSSFKAFSSTRSSLTLVESCVDFEVAHLSVLMAKRLLHGRFLP